MINEEKVLDKIAEMLGDSCKMNDIYGNEENVAYACGFNDRTMVELMRFVEDLANAEKYETDEDGYLVPKKEEPMIKKKVLSEAIEEITSRMELYMEEIADCGGDQNNHDKLEHLIAEDQAILDILIKIE